MTDTRKTKPDVWNNIRRIIIERLAPTQIVDVEFEEDIDHDGDEIVRIGIVFADSCERPKAEKVVGLTGLVRKPLWITTTTDSRF